MQTSRSFGALWLPFTQMQDAVVRRFVRAHGTSLVDDGGRRLFDATSSIWTIVHGHGRPEIVRAIAAQAESLDHATLLGATHARAEELAERLCALAGLSHAFFSSDGASAIEAALKMSVTYWRAHGQPQRTRFVRLVHAYHGDTLGAMSVSDIGAFKGAFADVTFESLAYDGPETAAVLARDDVAAAIVEPGVQAAAGMRIVGAAAYAPFRLDDARAPLLIVDEIATGFGRTGPLFAFESLDLRPDIVCVGKGLTGGVLALSATLTNERVFEAFLAPSAAQRQFYHGHSFAGNPIACAAALASLDLFESDATLERVASLSASLDAPLRMLAAHPRVRDVRRCGLMCGVEIAAERFATRDRSAAWRVSDDLYERGFFTRPIVDVIQLVPPLTSTSHELDAFCDALARALDEVA
jgi:adenosylmethionine-8-amino-7-oxononanoate aminotransferase